MFKLLNSDVYLRMILSQEGVPFIFDSSIKRRIFIRQSETHLVISTKESCRWDGDNQMVLIKYVFPDDSNFFLNLGVVDIGCKCSVPKSATIGRTDKNMPFVYLDDTRMVMPLKLSTLLAHRGRRLKQFYSYGKKYPFETVAVADRGGVRRLIAGCIRKFLFQMQIPYCHLSYVPTGDRSLFGFRVDTDFSSPQEIAECVRIANSFGMKWTWFIMTYNLSSDTINTLKESLKGQDVQVHCHEHRVHNDLNSNITNLSNAIKLLNLLNIKPVGAAAPYGIWNEALNRSYTDIGIQYSSEFGYAYDDLPSRPVINGQFSPVLQIPVHPVALGRLAWARMSPSEMVGYYKRIIDLQVARQEPCFLYDHPKTILRYPDVIKEVVNYGLVRCGRWMTMSDYAAWWQKRENVTYRIEFEGEELVLNTDYNDNDISVVIEKDNRIAYLPLISGRYSLRAFQWFPVSVLKFAEEEINTKHLSMRVRYQNLIRLLQQRFA